MTETAKHFARLRLLVRPGSLAAESLRVLEAQFEAQRTALVDVLLDVGQGQLADPCGSADLFARGFVLMHRNRLEDVRRAAEQGK